MDKFNTVVFGLIILCFVFVILQSSKTINFQYCWLQIILLIYMNFLNIIAAAQSLLNFNLNSQTSNSETKIKDSLDHSAFKKVASSVPLAPLLANPPSSSAPFDKIMEQRQKLINQYLQLNIQILEKQIKQNEMHPEPKVPEAKMQTHVEEDNKPQIDSNKKKIKKANLCGHQDKPHYAKGMCSNCYHRNGRVKKPWRCNHEKLYAAGMCQNCYINDYNRKRREESSKLQGEKEEQSVVKGKSGGESLQIINQSLPSE